MSLQTEAATATLRISEIFRSMQGEGPSAGTPAVFIRLQGCTVGCHWCDTKYTWDAVIGDGMTVAKACDEAQDLGASPLLVVTGGEPLAQPGLASLLREGLARWPRVEVETSGLAAPPLSDARLAYSVSPKLPTATPRWSETWEHVPAWVAEPRATFKIVISDERDLEDVRRLIAEHELPKERVMLMPEGMNELQLRSRALKLAEACKELGVRMSPRLHIWLWGAKRGV